MELAGCWRYPVKSLQGFSVDSVDMTPAGVRGDRRRALGDTATGKVASAKRFPLCSTPSPPMTACSCQTGSGSTWTDWARCAVRWDAAGVL
jgi:uncharacterized protein YcbX